MRGFSFIFSSIAALTVAAAHASTTPDEIPAKPLHPTPPAYPAACMPKAGEAAGPQTVTVRYDVTTGGIPENARAAESTDQCFEEAAIAAIRGWGFTPRKVKGVAAPQEDLETTFTFFFQEPTQAESLDARPIYREPPRYPGYCADGSGRLRRAEKNETVTLDFDVTPEGTTENVEVVDTTNSCYNAAAATSVKKWRYTPKMVAGKPVARKGVQTNIRFELRGRSAPDEDARIRSTVRSKLQRANTSLKKDGEPQKILAQLAEIEAEFGGSFSIAELIAFHHIRGLARIQAGDYPGALDDLRVVQQNTSSAENANVIAETIAQLEAVIAEQDAQAAAAQPSEAQGSQ